MITRARGIYDGFAALNLATFLRRGGPARCVLNNQSVNNPYLAYVHLVDVQARLRDQSHCGLLPRINSAWSRAGRKKNRQKSSPCDGTFPDLENAEGLERNHGWIIIIPGN
jgi:hypothetical protein